MIPKEFYIMQSIPLKENEKIDFAALEKQKHTLLVTEHRAVEGLTKSEETILHVWRNVFNDDSITIHEDFFELGGDSMLALQIIANLSKHYNHIPLHYLFEYPTVSILSNKLAEFTSQKVKTHLSTSNKHSAALVKLSSGNSLPIFLVHPVGGSVFWYKKLSTYLNDKYTVYGIQDPSIDGSKLRFKKLEDMADYYLNEIKSIYAGESYFIGGASFGSTIAFEMAKQLIYANKKIDFLGLFDGWAKYSDALLKENSVQLLYNRESNRTKISDKKSTHLYKIEEYRKQLLIDYKLVSLNVDAYLFKAADLWSYFLELNDNYNGWKPFITGKVVTYKVPGNHETIFFNPNVEILAKYLLLSLKR